MHPDIELDTPTPAPATSVTVNGQAAQAYGDFTFARTNLSLVNGQNRFTNIAQNAYGLKATNILTVNLPTNVNLTFDNNGNLTNDGLRSLSYDTENQLTNVMVAGQWRAAYVYDGLGRRRIAEDYTWQSNNWVPTNEVLYIYDGMLVVQERNSNNVPLVTYTRGLDFGGGLRRAGGIGGLLARTDTNGSTFYHADAIGNITALMDGNENIVGRYMYGPFGKLTGKWGPMADANVMQFSSMPQHDGLVFYPFRVYDPNLRWLTEDPIGEAGGINLYQAMNNNPLSYVDPLGLVNCAFLASAIAHQEYNIRGAIRSMSDFNKQFANSRASSLYSLEESGAFALYSLAGLGVSLTENAAKNATYAVQVSRGTIPVGVIGANTTGGSVVLAGSGIAGPVSAANVGAGVIGAKEAGQEIGQEGASRLSTSVQRVLDPYGRLADVQNQTGAQMSASTSQIIKGLQSQLANMMDMYRQNCPCKK